MSDKKTPDTQEEIQEEIAGDSAGQGEDYLPYSADVTVISTRSDTSDSVPLWLITFTDVMALMLTFFVLLYSMSQPDVEKWTEMMSTMTVEFSKYYSEEWQAGEQETISIEKVDYSRALSLDYLRALLSEIIQKDESLRNIKLFQDDKRLIVSLPSELLFATGSARVNDPGRQALFALGGLLSRIRNRLEVIGHSDPRPVRGGQFTSNWDLSLARATSVSAVLTNVGYRRPITVRGLASARFEELPGDLSRERKLELARRVDIVIMKDDGSGRQVTVFGTAG